MKQIDLWVRLLNMCLLAFCTNCFKSYLQVKRNKPQRCRCGKVTHCVVRPSHTQECGSSRMSCVTLQPCFYLWTGSRCSRSSTALESPRPAPLTAAEGAWAESLRGGTAALLSSPSSLAVWRLFHPEHTGWTAGARATPASASSRRERGRGGGGRFRSSSKTFSNAYVNQ